MIIAAVDPGVHRCAVARFVDGALCDAFFIVVPTFKRGGPTTPAAFPKGAGRVVVEMPQYDGRARTARAQDLIRLAWHGALAAAALAYGAPIVVATPTEWKGSEHKPQHHARLWSELDARERRALGGAPTEAAILTARERGALARWAKPGGSYYPRGFDTHNLLDAAALGAWFLGRLAKA